MANHPNSPDRAHDTRDCDQAGIAKQQKAARRARLLERFYPEAAFGGYAGICPDVNFLLRVNSLLRPDAQVVDLGCGRGCDASTPLLTSLLDLRGDNRHVIGLDVDAAAKTNPRLDEFRMIDGPTWPLADESVDLILSRYVLEHVQSPDEFFAECRRVLRAGGVACFLTSNVCSYFGLAARLIPNRLHARTIRFAHATTARSLEEDVFPTFHRCNTVWSLRRYLRTAGFEAYVSGHVAPPNYLEFSTVAYGLGVLYQKFAPRFIQPSLIAFARRPV